MFVYFSTTHQHENSAKAQLTSEKLSGSLFSKNFINLSASKIADCGMLIHIKKALWNFFFLVLAIGLISVTQRQLEKHAAHLILPTSVGNMPNLSDSQDQYVYEMQIDVWFESQLRR